MARGVEPPASGEPVAVFGGSVAAASRRGHVFSELRQEAQRPWV